jgi:hypothetical protein
MHRLKSSLSFILSLGLLLHVFPASGDEIRILHLAPQSKAREVFSLTSINRRGFFVTVAALSSVLGGYSVIHQDWSPPRMKYPNPAPSEDPLTRIRAIDVETLAKQGLFLEKDFSDPNVFSHSAVPFGTRWNEKEARLLMAQEIGLTLDEKQFQKVPRLRSVFNAKLLEILRHHETNLMFNKFPAMNEHKRWDSLGRIMQSLMSPLSRDGFLQVDDLMLLNKMADRILGFFPDLPQPVRNTLYEILTSAGIFNAQVINPDGSVSYKEEEFEKVNKYLRGKGYFIDFSDLAEMTREKDPSPFFFYKVLGQLKQGEYTFLYLDTLPYGSKTKGKLGIHNLEHNTKTLRIYTDGLLRASLEQYAATHGMRPLEGWELPLPLETDLATKSLHLYQKAESENSRLRNFQWLFQIQILLVSLHEFGHGRFGANEVGANLLAMALGNDPHMMLANILRWYGTENKNYGPLYETLEKSTVKKGLFPNVFDQSSHTLREAAKDEFLRLHPSARTFFESGEAEGMVNSVKGVAAQIVDSMTRQDLYHFSPIYRPVLNRAISSSG